MSENKRIAQVFAANYEWRNGENRCKFCYAWQYEGKHKKDCPMGEILVRVKSQPALLKACEKISVIKQWAMRIKNAPKELYEDIEEVEVAITAAQNN